MHYLRTACRGPTIHGKRILASGSATERRNWCRIYKATMTTSWTRCPKQDSLPFKAASTCGTDQQGTRGSLKTKIKISRTTWRAFYLPKGSGTTKIRATCILWLRSSTQTMRKCCLSRWRRSASDLWWKEMFQRGRPRTRSKKRATSA